MTLFVNKGKVGRCARRTGLRITHATTPERGDSVQSNASTVRNMGRHRENRSRDPLASEKKLLEGWLSGDLVINVRKGHEVADLATELMRTVHANRLAVNFDRLRKLLNSSDYTKRFTCIPVRGKVLVVPVSPGSS